MRIFIAGFQHETNTFAPSPADWAAFECGAGYPAATHGSAMLAAMRGGSMPIGGFIEAASEYGWTLLPSLWAGAVPSNRVTRDAFERIAGTITADLQATLASGPVDGIYLDLHGAAVAESADDAEGELLRRLRAITGPGLPIVASLDLHANVTEGMLHEATAMTAFRTYPHVDMRDTGARAARLLADCLRRGKSPVTHALRIPFLLPLNAQCTLAEPAASVQECLRQLEARHAVDLSFAMGFAAADFADCGPVVFGHGLDAADVEAAVQALHAQIVTRRAEWRLDLLSADEAVARAIELATPAGPVVIADTQDNPGAGGDANTTGLLRALLAARAGERLGGLVALGLLCDPEAAQAACRAGVGATLTLAIGRAVPTWSGELTPPPVQASVTVRAISDGVLPLHGPMTAGSTMQLGPSARVDVDGVQVLLTSAKAQMLDLDMFRFLGIEPASMRVLVNKSSVHFRAAFAPIAQHILVAKAPGPMAADPGELPWRHLAPSTAVRP